MASPPPDESPHRSGGLESHRPDKTAPERLHLQNVLPRLPLIPAPQSTALIGTLQPSSATAPPPPRPRRSFPPEDGFQSITESTIKSNTAATQGTLQRGRSTNVTDPLRPHQFEPNPSSSTIRSAQLGAIGSLAAETSSSPIQLRNKYTSSNGRPLGYASSNPRQNAAINQPTKDNRGTARMLVAQMRDASPVRTDRSNTFPSPVTHQNSIDAQSQPAHIVSKKHPHGGSRYRGLTRQEAITYQYEAPPFAPSLDPSILQDNQPFTARANVNEFQVKPKGKAVIFIEPEKDKEAPRLRPEDIQKLKKKHSAEILPRSLLPTIRQRPRAPNMRTQNVQASNHTIAGLVVPSQTPPPNFKRRPSDSIDPSIPDSPKRLPISGPYPPFKHEAFAPQPLQTKKEQPSSNGVCGKEQEDKRRDATAYWRPGDCPQEPVQNFLNRKEQPTWPLPLLPESDQGGAQSVGVPALPPAVPGQQGPASSTLTLRKKRSFFGMFSKSKFKKDIETIDEEESLRDRVIAKAQKEREERAKAAQKPKHPLYE